MLPYAATSPPFGAFSASVSGTDENGFFQLSGIVVFLSGAGSPARMSSRSADVRFIKKSDLLGCVRCSKQFDTTTARGRGELKKHCFTLFRETDLMESMRNVKRWIGVGGTITSLASMLQELEVYDSSKVQDYVIHPEDVSEILEKLSQMSYDDKCHMKGLLPSCADIIVAGVVILDSLMEYFALSEITVSDRDLSEGLLDADVISPTEK